MSDKGKSKDAYKLIPEAEEDFAKLDGSLRLKVVKALDKLAQNPKAKSEGGFGEPLGNKHGRNLTGFLKIKMRGSGIRIVYDYHEEDETSYVIVIGARKDCEVYDIATRRRAAYELWLALNERGGLTSSS